MVLPKKPSNSKSFLGTNLDHSFVRAVSRDKEMDGGTRVELCFS